MKAKTELFVKQLKEQMVETLESGQLEPLAQYAYVDGICLQLLTIDEDIGVFNAIKSYFDEQTKLKDEINNLNKQLKEKMDKIADNTKSIYEEIKKL